MNKIFFANNDPQTSQESNSKKSSVAVAVTAPSTHKGEHATGSQLFEPSVKGRTPSGKYPESNKLLHENTRINVPSDPLTVEEAMSCAQSNEWKLAMRTEFEALQTSKTWKLTDLPKGRKAIPCKWIFKTKKDVTGNVSKFKARLVIKGYSQRKGEDYSETFSPVVHHAYVEIYPGICSLP